MSSRSLRKTNLDEDDLELEESRKTITISVEVDYGVFEKRIISVKSQPCVILNENILYSMNKDFGNNTSKCMTIYTLLLSHRNRVNNRCFPSINRLSELSGLSNRTINSTLTLLEENNYIIINEGKSGKANEYFFPKEWFFDYFQDDIKQNNAYRPSKETRKEKYSAPKRDSNNKEQIKQKDKEIESNKRIIETLTNRCKQLDKENMALTTKLNKQEKEQENFVKMFLPYGNISDLNDIQEDFDDE